MSDCKLNNSIYIQASQSVISQSQVSISTHNEGTKLFQDKYQIENLSLQGMSSILLLTLVSLTSILCHPQPPSYADHASHHPQPYKYQYGVKDDYTNANFAKTESQDAKVSNQFKKSSLYSC